MMADAPTSRENALALLNWQIAAGVDFAVGETPIDRFAATAMATQKIAARAEPRAKTIIPGGPKPPSAPAPIVEDANPEEARALAAAAPDLLALETAMRAYDGCTLKLRATQLVFSDGNPNADIMFIGDAPGRDEDLQGNPFAGRSGQLLDKMLAAIGLDRTKVYLANTVPWRPPGNRAPTAAEIAICQPFLHRQIELVAPRLIVTLGAPATQTMFATRSSIARMRGQWNELTIGDQKIPALPTHHPDFLLLQPAQKRLAWQDLLALKQAIDAL